MILKKCFPQCQGLFLVLSVLTRADGSAYFPRQPQLPESVFLSIVKTEDVHWIESQLQQEFLSLSSPRNVSLGSYDNFLTRQAHFNYFEGDIIGYDAKWSVKDRVIDIYSNENF